VTVKALRNVTFVFAAAAGMAAAACGAPTMVAKVSALSPSSGPIATIDQRIGLSSVPEVTAALAEVNPKNIRRIDSTLVSFGTRNTFSDTTSPTHGIGAARRWIYSEFQRYSQGCGGCLRVEYNEKVQMVGRTNPIQANIVDVLAWLPGRDTSRVVVMSGHYDSCVCGNPNGTNDSTSIAPGADDDGSGSSAVIELARVFSMRFPKGLDASIIFVTVASEEQGLNGSRQLAEWLHEKGYKVVAGMTDDIVGNVVAEDGYTDSTSMRIFAADPDNSSSRELGRYVWGLNRVYLPNFEVLPVWRLDRIGRGGDHEPYVTLGDPGLRFTERVENYNRQHLPTDDFAHVNFGYVANVARVNAMTVASLAMAPATPANARAMRQGRNIAEGSSGGQAWTLSWEASSGATGYELLIRRTTEPTWSKVVPLGNITRCTLRRQLDDEWAAVRALGPGGSRSMAASMPTPNAPRAANGATAGGARGAGGGAGGAAGGAGGRGGPQGPAPPPCGA
jgi:hypothetical protein